MMQGCRSLHINEDNGRFLLLALLIIVYLLCGAAVFSAIERPSELRAHGRWNRTLLNFSDTFNISLQDLSSFLKEYEVAIAAGARVDALRPRWDFTGAFYFVGTVVSTIGFGMTTPVTVAGKIFLIFYGLLGCAATILFFNLFLERIITLLAVVMKAVRLRRLRTSGLLPPGICTDFAASTLPGWKPSVYHVMLILGLSAIVISCCASAMYTPVEGWAYLDSLYFCFVTFSTIGFGDLVSSQSAVYGYQSLYRLANCLFILAGVCCIYSLFNVISIVIKQVLNWMLGKMSCLCCQRCNKANAFLGRRNAIRPGSRLRKGRFGQTPDSDGPCDSDTEGRRLSGEMISMRDLTGSNKISLAIMQKQLSESANGYPRTVCGSSRQNGFSGGVGALGIMNNRLAETSDSR
ncbi:potassium channel subfamily K member 12 [Pimephales promelas]|uniref:potassium channel subfamily K member 12 n=1 Tax=Pimephales promelas TaxID=90988 RepID=UPI001955CE65|nr:potassium channel subfamily K member 12 [Pimephales promelas]KAG1958365.1 potassium channel subfamily K [Pimephales promelas]KAG1958366.1 potassium channel subfamily K [Pimephales promelas]KAG1958367.1 potassium channel subfamily K [Pimephales promelas]KAG1958368.1 potassium channel subfamily K [Pimephales promelas]KAG1958369.1 potassium channel subfamily K [Pimephales promelas]